MKRNRRFAARLAVLCLTAGLSGCRTPFHQWHLSKGSFHKITISRQIIDPTEDTVEITDPAVIKQFQSSITLVPKMPCMCAHFDRVIFHGTSSTTTVAICDHCFDVVRDRGVSRYRMPEAFHALVKKHGRETTQQSPAGDRQEAAPEE